MSIWKNVDPVGAIADLRTVWQQAGKNRWWIAVASGAVTAALFAMMFQENYRILPRPPKVTYITSWRADRTDAEIIATNRANELYQQKLRDEQAKREEEVREIYKKIGRASGMDVAAIEAKAKADKAAEEAAKKGVAPAQPPTQPQSQSQLVRP